MAFSLSLIPQSQVVYTQQNIGAPPNRHAPYMRCSLAQPAVAKKLRLTITGLLGSPNEEIVQISRVVFFNPGGQELAVDGGSVHNPGGNSPKAEQPHNLASRDVNTKWLDSAFKRNGRSTLTFEFAAPTKIGSFELWTANDFPSRDPVTWELATEPSPAEATLASSMPQCNAPSQRHHSYGRMPLAAPAPAPGPYGGQPPYSPPPAGQPYPQAQPYPPAQPYPQAQPYPPPAGQPYPPPAGQPYPPPAGGAMPAQYPPMPAQYPPMQQQYPPQPQAYPPPAGAYPPPAGTSASQ